MREDSRSRVMAALAEAGYYKGRAITVVELLCNYDINCDLLVSSCEAYAIKCMRETRKG